MTVHVTTPSTYNEMMNVIEKNKMSELVNNIMLLGKIYPPAEIEQLFPLIQIKRKMDIVYGYDNDKFTADTKKDVTTKQNEQKLAMLQQLASSPNQQSNAQNP